MTTAGTMSTIRQRIDEIKARCEAATNGPWQIVEDCYEDSEQSGKLSGRVAQRRIFTTWDHPQLKGPLGVVNGYTTIAKVAGEQPHRGVKIDLNDAAFIAGAREDIPWLLEQLAALTAERDSIIASLDELMGGADDGKDLHRRVRDELLDYRDVLEEVSLEIEVERKVVAVKGDSTKGRVAQLIASGFFSEARTVGEARKELIRTSTDPGGGGAFGILLGNLVKDGFLTRDGDAFVVASGIKITERELASR